MAQLIQYTYNCKRYILLLVSIFLTVMKKVCTSRVCPLVSYLSYLRQELVFV